MIALLLTAASTASLRAAVFETPNATYPTIQSAIDAAVTSGGTDEVRVQAGTYTANLELPGDPSWAGDLTVTGGWDATFAVRDPDPAATTIDGGGLGEVFAVRPNGGVIRISGFTVENGLSLGGGGAGIIADGVDATILLIGNVIRSNTDETASSSHGGGVNFVLSGASVGVFADNVVTMNLATSTDSSASAGGVDLNVSDTSTLSVQRNVIENNTAHTDTFSISNGCGMQARVFDDASLLLLDNTVRDNRCTGVGTAGGTGLHVGSTATGTVVIRRHLVFGNLNDKTASSGAQLLAWAQSGTLTVSDSVIAQGNEKGADIQAQGAPPVVRVTNLTVAEHSGTGLLLGGNGVATSSLHNTILFGNATDLDLGPSTADLGSNLIGVDPLFTDPSSRDFSLQALSPAHDAGDPAPPGGLGPADVTGGPRVDGTAVDQGAYEALGPASVFGGGFERGDLGRWE